MNRARQRASFHSTDSSATFFAKVLLLCVFLPAGLVGQAPAAKEEAGEWKYKYLTVVVQNSGAHRPNALALIELLNRLAEIKPPSVSVSMLGFDEKFRQLEDGRFARKVLRLMADTTSAQALREAVGELVFQGPSPVYDALGDALDTAAKHPGSAVLLLSNAIDNASDISFDDLVRRAEKSAVPVLAFYFPTNPPQNGDARMRRLAKVSGGRFVDVRGKDSWEQLVTALRP